MGKFFKAVTAAVLAGFIVVLSLGASIINFGMKSTPKKSDAIIVLGCKVYGTKASPFLTGRLDEGVGLYRNGYGKYIVVTGGKGPGEDISEAEAARRYLISKGVEEDKILVEDKSTSTMENIKYSREIMSKKDFDSAIIVSNKYHLKRASLMARKNGINGSYSGVFLSRYKYYEITGFLREVLALGKFYLMGR